MGMLERLAGVTTRDNLTEKAVSDAARAQANGLSEFTITVHSTSGGLALLPRLVPHVVSVLQEQGYAVINISTDEWAYNSHLTLRAPVNARGLNQTTNTVDPDLAEFHRAIAMSSAQPPGDLGKTFTAQQVVAQSHSFRSQYRAGNYAAIWERRVQLGYGVESDGVPQEDLFYLNALPALAALHLGYRDHPMVAMCAGMAESGMDRTDPNQAAAIAEIRKLYE